MGAAVFSIALLAVFLAPRILLKVDMANIDETIPIGVSHSMIAIGRLDPNWALAGLKYFRDPQYNFYSYNLISHLWIVSFNWTGITEVNILRLANLFYQTIGIFSLIFALRNLGFARWTYFAIASLFVLSPSLVHDAQMARTESFLFMLFGLAVLAASSKERTIPSLVVGELLIGVGAASKITFLTVALIFVPLVVGGIGQMAIRIGCLGASVLFGIRHFGALRHCALQYISPRAGSLGCAILGNSRTTLFYRSPRLGALYCSRYAFCLRSMASSFWQPSSGRVAVPSLRRGLALGLWLLIIVTVAYFGTRPVFFERNLSLAAAAAIVVYVFLLGTLRSGVLQAAGMIIAVLPMAFWSLHIALTANDLEGHRDFERANGLKVATFYPPNKLMTIAPCSGVFGSHDYNDELTVEIHRAIEAAGYRKVARYNSHFVLLPTSTLHTYLDPSFDYYECKPDEHTIVVGNPAARAP